MTRRPSAPDPDAPGVPAAPADVPPGTAPPSRSAPGTSETAEPVDGVQPSPGVPTADPAQDTETDNASTHLPEDPTDEDREPD